MIRDERGAAAVETVIVFPVFLLFFLGLYLLSYLFMADLIVERAASAAARAAAVYMAESNHYHPDRNSRLKHVEAAAKTVMSASPVLDAESVKVELTGNETHASMLTTRVDVDFDCHYFVVSVLCGLDGRITLNADASMPYQGHNSIQ